jgi:hypothetical protein
MKTCFLLLCAVLLVSCFGDSDDAILDGDLITAITGVDRIFITSSGSVDMETDLEESGLGTAIIRAQSRFEELQFSLSIRFPDQIDSFETTRVFTINNQVIVDYYIYVNDVQVTYIVDETAPFSYTLEDFNKNKILGDFEFTLVNVDDPLDTITFTEGYIYVYD